LALGVTGQPDASRQFLTFVNSAVAFC